MIGIKNSSTSKDNICLRKHNYTSPANQILLYCKRKEKKDKQHIYPCSSCSRAMSLINNWLRTSPAREGFMSSSAVLLFLKIANFFMSVPSPGLWNLQLFGDISFGEIASFASSCWSLWEAVITEYVYPCECASPCCVWEGLAGVTACDKYNSVNIKIHRSNIEAADNCVDLLVLWSKLAPLSTIY